MGQYYYMHRERHDTIAIATAPEDIPSDVVPVGFARRWQPIVLRPGPGTMPDYLPSDVGSPSSRRLRSIIQRFQRPDDAIQWLEAKVLDRTGKLLDYWFLQFTESADAIDWERSRVIDREKEVLGKIVLDAEKIKGRHVFGAPQSDVRVMISQELKDAIDAAKRTGITYSRVPDNRPKGARPMNWPPHISRRTTSARR
jgi:hypothetical protein